MTTTANPRRADRARRGKKEWLLADPVELSAIGVRDAGEIEGGPALQQL